MQDSPAVVCLTAVVLTKAVSNKDNRYISLHTNHESLVQKKIIAVVFSLIFIILSKAQDRTTWMREAHFGLMVHYLTELISIRRAFEGKVDGKQIHILSYLGKTWGMGEPRFTTEQVLSFSQQVIDQRGAISWDVPVLIDGTIENFFMQQLIELGKKYRR